jgi:adenylate cyclase
MAVFGAPVTLEDHALRACLAAHDIQREMGVFAEDIMKCDGVALQLRIGLNSGQVIAGEIGSSAAGYTTIGEQVGMAQRMESVAPHGGVTLSESTARLVENSVKLGDVELVHVKGADTPVPAQQLLDIDEHHTRRGSESKLVGRTWELNTIAGILEEVVAGAGCVVSIVGPPGIGKSRLVREASTIASGRGIAVFSTYCESHTSDLPFHAVARLLRSATGVDKLAHDDARAQLRAGLPDANDEDLLFFEDLLGVSDPTVPLPVVAADARRRRLTAMLSSASLARTEPAVYVIEDAHWIDESSESMFAEFFKVIPQTPSFVLITYRPDYHGALTKVSGAQTIGLRPLNESQTSELTATLLGSDPSVSDLAALIGTRAAGNPFFVEEMLRDVVERGKLLGGPGAYQLSGDVTEITVPATLQATIGARIDRLNSNAKQALNAAAVIGMRFDSDLLEILVDTADLNTLVDAELLDQVRFNAPTEFAFRHPMIRTVAYESQLKSDRAQLHRRLAEVIEARGSADENAALVAEHVKASGDLRAAYTWHMRAPQLVDLPRYRSRSDKLAQGTVRRRLPARR